MTQNLWHRYSHQNFNILLAKLDSLQSLSELSLDRENREKITLLRNKLQEAYQNKEDHNIDLKLLAFSLEFSLLQDKSSAELVTQFIKKIKARAS